MSTEAHDRIGKVIDLAVARGERTMHDFWQSLAKTREGAPLPTLANLLLIFAHDPDLTGIVTCNDFTAQYLITRPPPPPEDGAPELPGPWPRAWGPEEVAFIQAHVQRVYSPKFSTSTVEQGMLAAAAHARFHPVRDWLDTLTWDGTPRIDTWLAKAFGCAEDDYHRAVGAKLLLAAVRRVRSPGCKFDHMPVLEGAQGIGKSTTLRALFGNDWFSDAIPENIASRDAAMSLLGVWGLEFGEIEHLVRTEVETIKAFLSRQVDRYRPPYGKTFIERPRQGVFVGTTNSDEYLRDATGNRRIWPVRCHWAAAEWVAMHREQLWAEAGVREAAGETLWLDDADVRATAEGHQRDRLEEDVWTGPVRDYLAGRDHVHLAELLSDAICIPRERQGRREQMRVGKILTTLGWKSGVIWNGSRNVRAWARA